MGLSPWFPDSCFKVGSGSCRPFSPSPGRWRVPHRKKRKQERNAPGKKSGVPACFLTTREGCAFPGSVASRGPRPGRAERKTGRRRSLEICFLALQPAAPDQCGRKEESAEGG